MPIWSFCYQVKYPVCNWTRQYWKAVVDIWKLGISVPSQLKDFQTPFASCFPKVWCEAEADCGLRYCLRCGWIELSPKLPSRCQIYPTQTQFKLLNKIQQHDFPHITGVSFIWKDLQATMNKEWAPAAQILCSSSEFSRIALIMIKKICWPTKV